MKKVAPAVVITTLLLSMLFFSVRAQTPAQQQCVSDRGGYCIKLVAPRYVADNGPSQVRLLLAQVPGLEFLTLTQNASFGDVLQALYYFILSIVGISALMMFVWGGIEYMIAGDKDPTQAKTRMRNAVFGLVVALTSYTILYTINPDLVTKLDISLDDIVPPAVDTGVQGHLACVANTCTFVDGPGINNCDACRNRESHFACDANNQCKSIDGPGTDDCTACPGVQGLYQCVESDATFPDKRSCQSVCKKIVSGKEQIGTCNPLQ